jgi:hypothetical protein
VRVLVDWAPGDSGVGPGPARRQQLGWAEFVKGEWTDVKAENLEQCLRTSLPLLQPLCFDRAGGRCGKSVGGQEAETGPRIRYALRNHLIYPSLLAGLLGAMRANSQRLRSTRLDRTSKSTVPRAACRASSGHSTLRSRLLKTLLPITVLHPTYFQPTTRTPTSRFAHGCETHFHHTLTSYQRDRSSEPMIARATRRKAGRLVV